MRGSVAARRTPTAMTPPEKPTLVPISGRASTASRVVCQSGTAASTSGRMSRSITSALGLSPAASAARRSARASSAPGRGGRSPVPGSSIVTDAKPSAAAAAARARSRGYIRRVPNPPGWFSRSSGTGDDGVAVGGIHRMPVKPASVNSRSRTPSSSRVCEVKRMVMPFGSTGWGCSQATSARP